MFENGDVFAVERHLDVPGITLRYQVIEADRVTTPMSRISDRSIREGIVVGPWGEHLGYYIKDTHPGDTQSKGYLTDDF
jgi:capsid protein